MIDQDAERKKKLAHLFATAKTVGYSDETLREIAAIETGKNSLRALDVTQLKSIIAMIRRAHPSSFTNKRSPKKRVPSIPKNSSVESLRTPDQIDYSKKLESVVQKTTEYKNLTLDSISLRMFQKPFIKLSRHEDQSVIEALKKILIRTHKERFNELLAGQKNKNKAFSQLLTELAIQKESIQ